MNRNSSNYISSQNGILSTGAERLPELNLHYFEGASLDAREYGQPSEDFVSYQYKDDCLYFVVCDGVQQTIDSSFAARQLGMGLLEETPFVVGNKQILENFAEKLRSTIDRKILSLPVDKSNPLPEFHIRARMEIGAQVKFTCGVADFHRRKIELFWAGDIRFVIYGKNSEIITFWEGDNNQFWSTRGDYSLNLSFNSWSLEDVSRLSITSDGIRENFKEILNQKTFLDDIRLINHRYEIGADDISGIDIKIVPNENIEWLSSVRDISLINNKMLVWTGVPHAEKYRIYYVLDNSVQHILETDSKQKSYLLPDNLGNGDFYIQALSSDVISSILSEPVRYNPLQEEQLPEQNLQDVEISIPKSEQEENLIREKAHERKSAFGGTLTIIIGVITVLSLTIGIVVGLSGGHLIFKISILISIILVLIGVFLLNLANEEDGQLPIYVNNSNIRMVPVLRRTGKKRNWLLFGGWGNITLGIMVLILAFSVVPDSPILVAPTPTQTPTLTLTYTATLTSTPTSTPTYTPTLSTKTSISKTPTRKATITPSRATATP